MHLGDAHPLRDLALGQVLDEAEVKHLAVPLGDLLERWADRGTVLDRLEAGILLADSLPQR